MQAMSITELMWEWALMSTWMMAPLALILALRIRKSFGFVALSVLSFLGVWIVLSIPIALSVFSLHNFNHTLTASAFLAVAGAYQFTRKHENAVLNCMKPAVSNTWFGARTGWTCFVACGPLMVAAFAVMPSSPWFMVGITLVMVAEFISTKRFAVARIVGLAAGVAAVGLLFQTGPIGTGNFPTISHNHTN